MPRISVFSIAVAFGLGASGCSAGWRRVDDLTPRVLPARAQVQLWQGDRPRLLHGVILWSDSLSGVPFTAPPVCDSCRVHVAIASIDSLRVGNKERAFFRSVELFLLVGVALGYVFRGAGGD